MADIETLKQELISAIDALDGTVTKEEILSLSLSVKEASASRIISVQTPDDLPDLQTDFSFYTLPSGSIFFVDSLGVLVMSCKTQWIGLDGRLLRDDVSSITGMLGWGRNSSGELGDGTTDYRLSPVSVAGGIVNWVQISSGDRHALAITNTGTAYAWGEGSRGRLGDGTIIKKSSPVIVVGGITWSNVSGGDGHSLGLSNGILYSWGYNGSGQLGDATTVDKSSPVTVVGGITNWSQMNAGGSHSLAITGGVAYTWGANNSGRLGDGTTIDKSSPVTVVGGITNWSQVSAGYNHSLGVTDTGVIYAWGSNIIGKLGDGTTVDKSSPVTVVGDITNWSQVSAGIAHSLALTDNGIAYAWGDNSLGELGDGTIVSRSSPTIVVGGITNWSQVDAGSTHSVGVTTNGIAYAWGSNLFGKLGDNTTVSKSSPVTIIGGITNWFQISAGEVQSLAIKAN